MVLLLVLSFVSCEKALELKDPENSPTAVFDELWKVMDRQYALFGVKGLNWDSVYQNYRPLVSAQTSEKDLFKILSNMLETLKDGHVTLVAAKDTFTYQGFYTAYSPNFNLNNVLNNYLFVQFQIIGPVILKVDNGLGYMYYRSFGDDLSDVQADSIFSELSQTHGLIIDVRGNTGGSSQNVTKIFSRFISTTAIVKYEMSKNGPGHNDFSSARAYSVGPAKQQYTNPVAVLTNRACFSACNDFVLYMSEMPNVTIIGDQTGGGGSIPQRYILANGWSIQYSSTITLSPAREPVENGIQPDINAGISTVDEFNGRDPILDRAILLLQ